MIGNSRWIEAKIRHRHRYGRWLLGVHGAYLILKQSPAHLAALKREGERLLNEAEQLRREVRSCR